MKARILVMTILFGALAGCTDTGDSIAREYRNQINEAIDAMMLVVDEPSAKQMTMRVFKPMGERFKEIDRRLGLVRGNREKKPFALEFGLSDSVNMYIAEVYINRGRFNTEWQRLKDLTKKTEIMEEKRHNELGIEKPFDPNDYCKELRLLSVDPPSALGPLDSQVNKTPAMFGLMNEWKDWKLDKELLEKIQEKRALIKKFGVPQGELK